MKRPLILLQWTLLLLAAAFFALHYVHLRADFPNNSPWVDWAKYTDEGWYGDAAIRYHLSGRWDRPGDFNPAAALPVWPVLEGALFGLTGVGIVPARALAVTIFLGSLIVIYFLMRHRPCQAAIVEGKGAQAAQIAPAVAVLSLCVSPYLFAFSRMAILEPLLILLTLLAMLVAWRPRAKKAEWLRCMVLGLLVALMIGTKTTAVALLPAVAGMLWNGEGKRWKPMLTAVLIAGATAAAAIGMYLWMVVHSGHWADFKYLFAANHYTGISRKYFWAIIKVTLSDTMWTGPAMCLLAALVVTIATIFRRRIWRDPLFTGCALWGAGYFAFLAYHASFQPRYYMVIAFPLTVLAVRGVEDICVEWPGLSIPLGTWLGMVMLVQGARTLGYVRHPEYTFANAAQKVKAVVDAEKGHSRMVLSISGSDLTLMTGLPSICDDFGTLNLDQRVARYKPGWFVAWNFIEDDKMDALSGLYRVTRVAEFPAMDDPDRNLLIVYRLDPKK